MLAVPSGMLQAVQRVHCRSLSLDSSGPQRITDRAGKRRAVLAAHAGEPKPRRRVL